MFVYYIGQDRGGQPALASVAPDIYVVFGVPDRPDRDSYVLYREPDADIRFVLEIASQSTWTRDHGHKRHLYASLHVTEYFLFDPPTASRPAPMHRNRHGPMLALDRRCRPEKAGAPPKAWRTMDAGRRLGGLACGPSTIFGS